MKYLMIENGCGYYTLDGDIEHKKAIDEISKEDLLSLLNTIIDKDDFEMDEYDENLLHNVAHRVIYKNIYENFERIMNDRMSFKDESNSLYREAIDKYSVELKKIK